MNEKLVKFLTLIVKPRNILSKTAEWWKEEREQCEYFAWSDDEIKTASKTPEGYLGNRLGVECYLTQDMV